MSSELRKHVEQRLNSTNEGRGVGGLVAWQLRNVSWAILDLADAVRDHGKREQRTVVRKWR